MTAAAKGGGGTSALPAPMDSRKFDVLLHAWMRGADAHEYGLHLEPGEWERMIAGKSEPETWDIVAASTFGTCGDTWAAFMLQRFACCSCGRKVEGIATTCGGCGWAA